MNYFSVVGRVRTKISSGAKRDPTLSPERRDSSFFSVGISDSHAYASQLQI